MRMGGRTGRAGYVAVAAALLFGAGAAVADNPVTPADGGSGAAACYEHAGGSTEGYRFCRSLQALEWLVGGECPMALGGRPPAPPPEYCGLVDGREVSEAKVAAYETSWVHRALGLQRALDADMPFPEQLI